LPGSTINAIFFLIAISQLPTMSKKDALQFVSRKFEVFTRKPVQHAEQASDVVIY
jgi:hypothetical protein